MLPSLPYHVSGRCAALCPHAKAGVPSVSVISWVALYVVSTGQRVVGVASLWSAVVLGVLTMAAPVAVEPCPAGQVPVTRGGVCVPFNPLLPGPTTPTTAVPTTSAPALTATSDPSPGGPVPGPGQSLPTSTVEPFTPGTEPPGTEAPKSQTPGTDTNDAGATASATVTPSSEASAAQAQAVPTSSAEAVPGSPAAGLSAGQQTRPRSTLTAAGYMLVVSGILLLVWATVGLMLRRPAAGVQRA